METILACYFNTLEDPQRHIYWEGNNFAIIADLYFSLQRLNLNGIIFHDHLNEEFINKWQTDRIRFIYYKPERNTNNDRWRCYYNYLQENEIDKVFCLDLDVIININPFRLKDKLICGSEDRTIGNCGYMIDNFNISYKTIYFPDKKVLNCGIFGGNKKTVVFLLEQILKDFDLINSDVNIDMSVFNKVLYSNNIEIKTGYPIHTKFMSNLNNLNCYFKHK
jgi:hypothetical protein